jgi:hypothetical protein
MAAGYTVMMLSMAAQAARNRAAQTGSKLWRLTL